MAPDRMQLQSMSKRDNESFKEYAQRWRNLAAQVVPPMAEREMIIMIMDTLPVFYYEKMVGYMPSSFADLVCAGERIEMGLRKGKFDYAAPASSGNRKLNTSGAKRKEGEAHVVAAVPTWPNLAQGPFNSMYQYPPQQPHQPYMPRSPHYAASISPIPRSPPLQLRAPNRPQ